MVATSNLRLRGSLPNIQDACGSSKRSCRPRAVPVVAAGTAVCVFFFFVFFKIFGDVYFCADNFWSESAFDVLIADPTSKLSARRRRWSLTVIFAIARRTRALVTRSHHVAQSRDSRGRERFLFLRAKQRHRGKRFVHSLCWSSGRSGGGGGGETGFRWRST